MRRAAALLQPVLRRRMADSSLELRDANTQGNHLTFLMEHAGVPLFVRVEDGPERDDYMEVEAFVFDAVRQTGVPTPGVILADSSWSEVPLAYQVFESVPHPDLNHWLKRGELETDSVARQIGVLLANWQQIEPPGFGPFNPRVLRDEGNLVGLHERYETYFLLHWRRHLEFLVSRAFLTSSEAADLMSLVDQRRDLLRLDRGCLVHKDLALWNLLGTATDVRAVIDWDDSIAGDPTDDLSLLACFHCHEFMVKVLEGYQSVRPLPEAFASRFWLHLLRNMIVKATIRVGAGYFDKQDDFFLLPSGSDGKSLRQTTLERIRLAHEAVRDERPLSYLSGQHAQHVADRSSSVADHDDAGKPR